MFVSSASIFLPFVLAVTIAALSAGYVLGSRRYAAKGGLSRG